MRPSILAHKATEALVDALSSDNNSLLVEYIRQDQALRKNLSEEAIDNMLMQTFPASDPLGLY